jgi:lipopolysaccharide transport system ATP-binding protein
MRELVGLPSAASGGRKGEFFAVENLSFSVEKGECLGVIGPNGAGKTTLLRLINGLIKPDLGVLRVHGRVGGLIALGAGFNPVLTGRENIYINAAVLGLSKRQTDDVLDDIIDFSEIREFIDAPVQSYSSGMLVRLGFSVAVHLDPDVLLIDEVLAVGDAGFRGKCYNKVDELRGDKAVLLVSHNMEHIGRVCDRVLVLDRGQAAYCGAPEGAIACYRRISGSVEDGFVRCFAPIQSASIASTSPLVAFSGPLEVEIRVRSPEPVMVQPRIVVFDSRSAVVAEGNCNVNDIGLSQMPAGESSLRVRIEALPLQAGDYAISVNLHDQNGRLLVHGHRCVSFAVSGTGGGEHSVQLPIAVSRQHPVSRAVTDRS